MAELEVLVRLAEQRGFFFKSSTIYGGFRGFYDLGPLGVMLRDNIERKIREIMLQDIEWYEVSTSLIMPESVFRASGHLDCFFDPLVQCTKCNSHFRADHLIEEVLGLHAEGMSVEEMERIIEEHDLKCPKCKGSLSKPRLFQLMFSLQVGPVEGNIAYLRPETAQGVFVNFLNVARAMRAKLPFAIVQKGKSFRNEISPRQALIRLREFTQFEIELFFDPSKEFEPYYRVENERIRIWTREAQKAGEGPETFKLSEALEEVLPNQALAYFLAREAQLFRAFGVKDENFWFRHMLPEETPHYSGGNFDLEYRFEWGVKEVVGNAYRTDYDLKKHSKFSGKALKWESDGKFLVPHVVEPSFGFERIMLVVLHEAYRKKGEGKDWEWLSLPKDLAPYRAVVLPLIKKDDAQVRLAREIFEKLRRKYSVYYDDSGSIGKRYARADQIGVPFAITIDHQSLEDGTVTIRFRNTGEQIRVRVEQIEEHI